MPFYEHYLSNGVQVHVAHHYKFDRQIKTTGLTVRASAAGDTGLVTFDVTVPGRPRSEIEFWVLLHVDEFRPDLFGKPLEQLRTNSTAPSATDDPANPPGCPKCPDCPDCPDCPEQAAVPPGNGTASPGTTTIIVPVRPSGKLSRFGVINRQRMFGVVNICPLIIAIPLFLLIGRTPARSCLPLEISCRTKF